jgi:hypothetical protein
MPRAIADSTKLAPLTKDDLAGYLSQGCKPRSKWRCVDHLVCARVNVRCCKVCLLAVGPFVATPRMARQSAPDAVQDRH